MILNKLVLQDAQHDLVRYKCDYMYKTLGPMSATELANTISNLFQFCKLPGMPWIYNGNEMLDHIERFRDYTDLAPEGP